MEISKNLHIHRTNCTGRKNNSAFSDILLTEASVILITTSVRKIFSQVSRELWHCNVFALLHCVIFIENLSWYLNQWNTKLEQNAIWRPLSRFPSLEAVLFDFLLAPYNILFCCDWLLWSFSFQSCSTKENVPYFVKTASPHEWSVKNLDRLWRKGIMSTR